MLSHFAALETEAEQRVVLHMIFLEDHYCPMTR